MNGSMPLESIEKIIPEISIIPSKKQVLIVEKKLPPTCPPSAWYCYTLVSLDRKRTYIGKTNDLERRLRQHNGEIAGGARSTRGRGPFKYAFYTTGFQSEGDALCFEWAMHHPTGKRRQTRKPGLRGAIAALIKVLNKERWTRKCAPARQTPLIVHWNLDPKEYSVPSPTILPPYVSVSVSISFSVVNDADIAADGPMESH